MQQVLENINKEIKKKDLVTADVREREELHRLRTTQTARANNTRSHQKANSQAYQRLFEELQQPPKPLAPDNKLHIIYSE